MANRVRVSVGSEQNELNLVYSLASSFSKARGLSDKVESQLLDLIGQLGGWIIDRAYRDDPTGELAFQLELAEGEVRVTIEDWGEPVTSFGGGASPVPAELADADASTTDLRLVNLGREGKRLSFAIPAPEASSEVLAGYGHLMRSADPTEASSEDLEIRDSTAEDAEAISRLLFTNYGLGYGHPEFYRPLWLIEQLNSGHVASTVAVVSGEVIGHHALLLAEGEGSAETGIAVVHPAYRGLGAFGKLFDHTLQRAKGLGLDAVFGRAVTSHPYSQRAELSHGYLPSALMLGIVPVQGRDDMTARGATLVSFLPIKLSKREVNLPARYAEALKTIYTQLGLEAVEAGAPAASIGADLPAVTSVADDERSCSTITVHRFSDETRPDLIKALRHSVHRHDDVAICDLDLHSLSAAELDGAVELLREYDFFFSGLMPFGPAGHDRLRLQALLTDNVELDQILLDSDAGEQLKTWVFEDHKFDDMRSS